MIYLYIRDNNLRELILESPERKTVMCNFIFRSKEFHKKSFYLVLVCFGALCITAACGPSNSSGSDGDAAVDGDGNLLPDSAIVDGDGSLLPDSTPQEAGMQGCDPQTFGLQQAPPPEVFLVVDRSGSMLDEGTTPGMTLWEELMQATSLVLDQFESQIQFGLLMYPSEDDECVAPGHQVQVDIFNKLDIEAELSTTTPYGGTPTAAAIRNASHSLEWLGDTGSEKFVILLTDGGPNCNFFLDANPCSCALTDQSWCCTNYPNGECYFGQYCLDDIETTSEIQSLHEDEGVDTFVIGLEGTSQFAETLNDMANAGGRPQAGPTSYYDASNQAALTEALEEIAGSLISCRIELDEPPYDPNLVYIYVDGEEVPRDPSDGWNYTDDTYTEIELLGSYCETLKDGEDHELTATFACDVD